MNTGASSGNWPGSTPPSSWIRRRRLMPPWNTTTLRPSRPIACTRARLGTLCLRRRSLTRPESVRGVAGDHGPARHVDLLQDGLRDLLGQFGLFPESLLGGIATLSDQFALVGDP